MSETQLVEKLIEHFRKSENRLLDNVIADAWHIIPMQAYLAADGRTWATYARAQQAVTKALRVYMYG